MKKQFLFIALLTIISSAAYPQATYSQFEVLSITPKLDKLDLFRKALSAHNKKYHTVDPYKVSVYSVDSGPNAGSFVWVMGPCSMTQLDKAPGEGEHILDWEKNINPHVASMSGGSYWRAVADLNYEPEGAANFKRTRVRFNTVYPGQMDRYIGLLKKVAEVYKQKKYATSFSAASHWGATSGPNVVTFNGFGSWSAWDSGNNFAKDYDEIHGTGAFERFLQELDLCVDRSKTFDEINTLTDLGS